MYYLRHIKTGAYVEVLIDHTGPVVRYAPDQGRASGWSTLASAAYALATLENLGAIPHGELKITVEED